MNGQTFIRWTRVLTILMIIAVGTALAALVSGCGIIDPANQWRPARTVQMDKPIRMCPHAVGTRVRREGTSGRCYDVSRDFGRDNRQQHGGASRVR